VNAFLANVELGSIKDLLQFDQVQSIQLQSAGEKPPADANPNKDVLEGRGRIVSDPYFNLPNMTGGFVGLLDTGVRTTHTTFAAGGGDHIDFLRDCVNGGATCNNTGAPGFNTDDDCWNHGTSTAGIVTGNAGLNATAVLRAFQRGLLVFDRIFIAEMQAWESENGTIATAADNAFAAGAV